MNKWKIITFLADYTHAKLASDIRERYHNTADFVLYFSLNMDINAKSLKKQNISD